MITAGALIAPLILYSALQARLPTATDNSLHQYRNELPADAVSTATGSVQVDKATLDIALFETPSSAAAWQVRLSPVLNRQTAGPDVLLYWQLTQTQDRLAADARFLGPLLAQRASVFSLTVEERSGQLVFFSLAHQRVVESVDLTTLTGGL